MSKSYHLKLSEEYYQGLDNRDKLFLNNLGLEVRQVPTDDELKDEKVKSYKREIAKNYQKINDYLFDIRNK